MPNAVLSVHRAPQGASLLALCFCIAIAAGHAAYGAGLLDINSADAATLAERLPGIGPVKARAIVEHRRASGGFGSVDALLEVRGIGPKTLERLRPLVRVGTFHGSALAPRPGVVDPPELERAVRDAIRAVVRLAARDPR